MRFIVGQEVWHYFNWVTPHWQRGTVTEVCTGPYDYRNVHFPNFPYGSGRWSVPARKLLPTVPFAFAGIHPTVTGDA